MAIRFAKEDTIQLFKNIVSTKDGNQFVRYSSSISRKLKDGTYERMYYTVRFYGEKFKDVDRDTDVNLVYTIKVLDGWLTFETFNQGELETQKLVLMIQDCEMVDSKAVQKGADGSTASDAVESPFRKKNG